MDVDVGDPTTLPTGLEQHMRLITPRRVQTVQLSGGPEPCDSAIAADRDGTHRLSMKGPLRLAQCNQAVCLTLEDALVHAVRNLIPGQTNVA